MKRILILTLTLMAVALSAVSADVVRAVPFGVNLAGAEFYHKKMEGDGRLNQDYHYPTPRELDYWQSKDMRLIRLPFKWDRIQRNVGDTLYRAEVEVIRQLLREADRRQMSILIDMHNYGRRNYMGKYRTIGDTLTPQHFAQAWAAIARELRDEPGLFGYGLCNEPHDMLPQCPWDSIAQVAIDSIRTVDRKTPIVVGGNEWSSAARWQQLSDMLKDLHDPADNLIFEAHCYFDSDASGIYRKGYDEEGAYPTIGIDRARPFVEWCERNGKRGLLGEYGVPADDPRWLECLDLFLNYLHQHNIGGTYWAAGARWNKYILGVHPEDDYTKDRPQVAIMQRYTTDRDIVVLGATPGGIMTAIEAARMGKRVTLLERSAHIGGLPANGLGATDIATRGATTGLFSEFTRNIKNYYINKYGADSQQAKDCSDGFHFEPHVAAAVFSEMLAAEGDRITVLTQRQFNFQRDDIRMDGDCIKAIRVVNRTTCEEEWYDARIFVDATYEGDLGAAAGVPFRIGREAAKEFGEPGAGKCYEYWKSDPADGTTGEGDDAIQAYNYRLCLTSDKVIRIPFGKPRNYNREEYVSLVDDVYSGRNTWSAMRHVTEADLEANRQRVRRGEKSTTPYDSWGITKLVTVNVLPNGKHDGNNQHGAFISTDLPEENWPWPTSSWEWRDRFAQRLREYTEGLFYFASHDKALPKHFRKEIRQWGMARDEYEDNAGFPRQVYVREGRRFEGMYFFTANDALPVAEGQRPPMHATSITASHYALDSHAARKREAGRAHLDGFISYKTAVYNVPYGVIVPKTVSNLLLPVPVSGSHIGFSTLRMEPCWMALGQAAGAAAAIAINSSATVQRVSIEKLQDRLLNEGATLVYFEDARPGDPGYVELQKRALKADTIGWKAH